MNIEKYFLNLNNKFSFLYDGKSLDNLKYNKEELKKGNQLITTYYFEDGLKITNIATYHDDFDAIEWVNYFENTSNINTKVISQLYDADFTMPFSKEEPYKPTAYMASYEDNLHILVPTGSTCEPKEFYTNDDEIAFNHYVNLIHHGDVKYYHTSGARSSEERAPFVLLHKKDEGYLVGIGWTGQWFTKLTRNDDGVNMVSGIENVNFYLKPNESFRTSSILIMKYNGSEIDASNKWRRLIKKYYSLIGQPGRDKTAPLTLGVWGGMSTKGVLERLKVIKEHNIPIDYVWMDAGWYGTDPNESPDEFEGNWSAYCGDWQVNEFKHPDRLEEVAKTIKDYNYKFLLWFEVERAIKGTPITKEHPEYFLDINSPWGFLLLNLGNKDAWNYIYNLLCNIIERLDVKFYRQDFNIPPLEYFNKYDEENRNGITEILHINGLYNLWDALLNKFPNLMIDNCASGGKRIDIETLKRSVPLWRSDAACSANFPVKINQMQTVFYGTWIPYSGDGAGRTVDTYNLRSCYAPALAFNLFFSERDPVCKDEKILNDLKALYNEFLEIRDYLSCDMYPLIKPCYNDDSWAAIQYNSPEKESGIILAFRREKSSYKEAQFKLFGLKENKNYLIIDKDSLKEYTISGKELMDNGFNIIINSRRESKLFIYKEI